MERKLTDEEYYRLRDYLEGSCRTLDEALESLFGMDFKEMADSDHYRLDGDIFLCESCGWWVDVAEMAADEEMVCEDCSEESNG